MLPETAHGDGEEFVLGCPAVACRRCSPAPTCPLEARLAWPGPVRLCSCILCILGSLCPVGASPWCHCAPSRPRAALCWFFAFSCRWKSYRRIELEAFRGVLGCPFVLVVSLDPLIRYPDGGGMVSRSDPAKLISWVFGISRPLLPCWCVAVAPCAPSCPRVAFWWLLAFSCRCYRLVEAETWCPGLACSS